MTSAKSKTGKTAASHIDDAIATGVEAAETIAKSSTETARKGFETVTSMGREAIGAALEAGAGAKGFEKATELPKANFEAMVEVGAAFAKGVEAINDRVFEIARARAAEGVETRRAVVRAGTFGEAVDVQRDYAEKSFDRAMRDGVEFSGAWMKLAAETTEPIGRLISDTLAGAGRPDA